MREATVPTTLIVDGARCWRAARDAGYRVQPRLFAMLAGTERDMLAPVLDSLLTLFETALGRPVITGGEGEMSEDERMLLDMIDGAGPAHAGSKAAAEALDCALKATRIMMALGSSRLIMGRQA